MGGAFSSTSNTSEQIGNQNLTQQFTGTCNITCDNTMSNVGINNINSSIAGNVEIVQTCSVNGQCVISNSMKSIADLIFKAKNSTNSDALGGSFSTTYNMSYQEINQNIQEISSSKCNIGSSNDMNNIFMYNINSQIGGNAVIGQSGSTVGTCVLNNIMNTSASASGIADNCAASGKNAKKKSCKGKGGGIGTYILYFIVGMIAFSITMMIIKFLRGNKLPPCTKKLRAAGKQCDPSLTAPPCSKAPKGAICEDEPIKTIETSGETPEINNELEAAD